MSQLIYARDIVKSLQFDLAHVYTTHARMDNEKLAPAAAEPSDGFLTFFTDGEKYGRSFRLANLPKMGEEVRDEVNTAIGAGRCISRAAGNLVLERQVYWLSALLVVIEEILKVGKAMDAAEIVKALDKLTVDESKGQPSPPAPSAMATDHKGSSVEPLAIEQGKALPPSLSVLSAMAMDHKASLEEHLELLTTEPAAFAHRVNDCYLSRAELLPEEKGRMLPAAPDKYLIWAIFDAVHHAVRSAAIWFYIHWLLHQLFSKTDHYGLRLVLQQELANVCHLEYTLSQSAFRAHVQTASGLKSFHRRSAPLDKSGRPTTVLKTKPQALLPSNPHLHHLLRLCEPSTTPAKALEHIKVLTSIHATDPPVAHQPLRPRVPGPHPPRVHHHLPRHPPHRRPPPPGLPHNQPNVHLPHLLPRHRTQHIRPPRLHPLPLYLPHHLPPLPHLPHYPPLLPPNAPQTLHTLTTTTTGTALGFLYQDLLDEATYYLSQLYHHWPHPPPPPVPSSEIVEWRQKRTARRNRATSRFPSAPPVTPDADDAPAAEDGAEGEPIEASAAAGETMATLFGKTGGGLTWTAFCAAVEELGFTKEDKVGAVVEFYPPPGLVEEGKGGVVVLRPRDGGEMEEWTVKGVGRRLREGFGLGVVAREV